jgi:hypothetical protein
MPYRPYAEGYREALGWVTVEPTRENNFFATIYYPELPSVPDELRKKQLQVYIGKTRARKFRKDTLVWDFYEQRVTEPNPGQHARDNQYQPLGYTFYPVDDILTFSQDGRWVEIADSVKNSLRELRGLRRLEEKDKLRKPQHTAQPKAPVKGDNQENTRTTRKGIVGEKPARNRGAAPPPVPADTPTIPAAPGEVVIEERSEKTEPTRDRDRVLFGTAWLPVAVPMPFHNQEWTLPDGYLRIGYISLFTDSVTESIQISEVMPSQSLFTVRSRTPIQKDNWHAARQVVLSFTFSDNESANEVLLPLVRLFQKAPFQPVFNNLLHDAGITALTLQNLSVETVPGIPNALKAVLSCQEFNWEAYLPNAAELDGMDSLLCYPLLKLWVESDWETPWQKKQLLHTPLPKHWDARFRMYHPDPNWLESVNEHEAEDARSGRLNLTIEAAKKAKELRGMQYSDTAPFGFKNSNWRVAPTAPPASEQVMTENVARVSLDGIERLIVTVWDVDTARHLLRSGEVHEVLVGEVTIRRRDRFGTAARPNTRGSWSNLARARNTPAQFQRLLEFAEPNAPRIGDPTTLRNLETGDTRFVLPLHAKVVDQIAGWERRVIKFEAGNPKIDKTSPFDPASMVVEQVSVALENVIAPLQVSGQRTPTHQYLGSQGLYFTLSGVLEDASEVQALDHFMERVNEMARQYRGRVGGEPFGGFVVVENELFQFMGVHHCIPVSWQVSTIPEFPDALRFELTLTSFDFTQRRREELNDLMQGAHKEPWLRVSSRRDSLETRYVRQEDLNNRLRAVDVYPDLKLPTQRRLWEWCQDIIHDRVWDWAEEKPLPKYDFLDPDKGGSGWQWFVRRPPTQPGERDAFQLPGRFIRHVRSNPPILLDRFADPDFYCEPSNPTGALFVDPMMQRIRKGAAILYRDPQGAIARTKFGDYLNRDAVHFDPRNSMEVGKNSSESRAIQPIGSTSSKFDQARWGNPEEVKKHEDLYWEAKRAGDIPEAQFQSPLSKASVNINPEANRGDLPGDSGSPGLPGDPIKNSTVDTILRGNVPSDYITGREFINERPPARRLSNVYLRPNKAALQLLQVPKGHYQKPQPGSIPVDDSGKQEDRIARYGPHVIGAADHYGVPRDLMFAIFDYESNWQHNRTSPAGAYGLGQIVQKWHPRVNIRDVATNINYACQLWRGILRQETGDWRRAIARYNWGIGNLTRNGIDRAPPETRAYWINIPKLRYYKYNIRAVSGPIAQVNPNLKRANDPKIEDQREASRTATNPDSNKKPRFVSREGEELLRKFKQGWGYSPQTIEKYCVNFSGPVKPFNVQPQDLLDTLGEYHKYFSEFSGFHSEWTTSSFAFGPLDVAIAHPTFESVKSRQDPALTRSRLAFIEKEWLFPVGVDAGSVAVNSFNSQGVALVSRSSWYQIQGRHIDKFLAAKRAAQVELKLEKIPQRLLDNDQKNNLTPEYFPQAIEQAFYNPDTGRDMFHDMRREFISGRLLGAFPTFYVAIVDGGRQLRIYRLYDHIYGMGAVTRISVHRTRKGPVETAVVGFSNMYGHLTSQTYELAREQSLDTRGVWLFEAIERELRAYGGLSEETMAIWAEHLDALMLRPGGRLHIRLGYGSDASDLPVVFNGTITEVPLTEGEMQVIALSDGIELLNDLEPTGTKGAIPTTRLNSVLGEGLNPREIVMSFMAPNNLWASFQNLIAENTLPLLYTSAQNRYGISHFGSPIVRGAHFYDCESGLNVYNPEFAMPRNTSSMADSIGRIFQFWKWTGNDKLIGIDMADARPWDIFDTCRKTTPDYLLYVQPVGMRSTLFMGKGWFSLFGEYRATNRDPLTKNVVGIDREDFFDWKPFQQIHLVSSTWNLLSNQVVADGSNVVTKVQAVGTYNGLLPGEDLSTEASFVMELDSDIYEHMQRMKVVKSGLYTTPLMKAGDGVSDEGALVRVGLGVILGAISLALRNAKLGTQALVLLLEGPFRAFMMSRRVLDYYAAMTLKDHVKDMYSGSLVLLGSPWFKPYDLVYIQDELMGLNGMAEVKQVVHTLSAETGYVTEITPDCCASFMDIEWQQSLNWAAMACHNMATAILMTSVISRLSRVGSTAAITRGMRGLEKWFSKSVKAYFKKGEEEVFGSANPIAIALAEKKMGELKQDFVKAAKAGNSSRMRELLNQTAELLDDVEAIKKVPFHLRAQLELQRFVRNAPGLIGTADEGGLAAGARTYLSSLKSGAANALDDQLVNLGKKVEEADDAVRALGVTEKQIDDVLLKARKSGIGSLTEAESAIRDAARVRDVARAQLKAANAGLNFSRKLGRAFTPRILRNTLKQAISRGGANVVLASVFAAAMGSLSDYVYRAAVARQCLLLMPLKLHEREFSAGINGHRGAVWGDRIGPIDQVIQWGLDTLRKSEWGGFVPIVDQIVSSDFSYNHTPLNQPERRLE